MSTLSARDYLDAVSTVIAVAVQRGEPMPQGYSPARMQDVFRGEALQIWRAVAPAHELDLSQPASPELRRQLAEGIARPSMADTDPSLKERHLFLLKAVHAASRLPDEILARLAVRPAAAAEVRPSPAPVKRPGPSERVAGRDASLIAYRDIWRKIGEIGHTHREYELVHTLTGSNADAPFLRMDDGRFFDAMAIVDTRLAQSELPEKAKAEVGEELGRLRALHPNFEQRRSRWGQER